MSADLLAFAIFIVMVVLFTGAVYSIAKGGRVGDILLFLLSFFTIVLVVVLVGALLFQLSSIIATALLGGG